MRKFVSIFCGVALIAMAAIIILSQTGVIDLGLSTWQIILAVVAIASFVTSVVKLDIGGAVIGLGLGWIALGDVIGLPHVKLWVVITVTILLAIGLSLIFPKKRFRRVEGNYERYEAYEDASQVGEHQQATYNDEAGFVTCSNKFGSLARYISSSNFVGADISNAFGSLNVYFDKANIIKSPVTINIKNDFGETQLYIPREWNVVNKINVFAGEVKGNDVMGNPDAPVVELVGSVSFGNLAIYRV